MTSEIDIDAPPAGVATDTWTGVVTRWHDRLTPAIVFWATAAGVLVLTLIRNFYVFTTHVHEDGDFALNSILVNHTHTSVQLVGNYSRVGFDHPGPAYIYVLSAGQTIFHDILHIVPTQYDGQIIGVAIMQAAFLGLAIMSIYLVTRSFVALLLSGSILFAFAATHDMLGYLWMPYLYMTAFALLLASVTALASGYTRQLPLVVLAGGFLVHGHVAFIAFVGMTFLVAVVSWALRYRHEWRAELARSRRSLLVSLILLLLFLAPMVAEIIRHFPGPWKDYYHYSTNQATQAHSVSQSVRYLGHFWTQSLPVWVSVAAAVVAVVGLVLDKFGRRRSYFIRGYIVLVAVTVACLYYISRGIDVLDALNYYTGFFYQTVPAFLLIFAVTHIGMLLHERLKLADTAGRGRLLLPIVAAVVAITLVISGAVSSNLTNPYRGSNIYPKIVTALANDPDRAGRPVVIDLIQNGWPAVAGTVIQADRSGLTVCLEQPFWELLFTAATMCPNASGHWRVGIVARSEWTNQGPIIWSDADTVVYEGKST